MSRRASTWPEASERLARRVTARDRVGALLAPFGWGLLAGGVLGVGLKLLGTPVVHVELGVGLAACTGFAVGVCRACRVRRVEAPDAAWALDRLAGAEERGLVAATVPGAKGAQAAWAAGRIDPPSVRLLPPRGFAIALGGALAVVLALVAPVPAVATVLSEQAARTGAAGGGDGSAGGLPEMEARAREDAERARTAAAVREALGLEETADTDRVAAELATPEAREAALEAAPEGSEVAVLLAEGASPQEVAEALAGGLDAEGRARAARRQAAGRRARGAALPPPPGRRALLEQYFWLLAEDEDRMGGE